MLKRIPAHDAGARSSIAAEVVRLAADEADQAEMRIIRERMAELAPDPVD